MRKIFIGLLLMIISTSCITAQTSVTISTNDFNHVLDLQSTMAVFAQSSNVEEFEQKLNDPRYNLYYGDLDNDGYIDYLQCVERRSAYNHFISIRAITNDMSYRTIAEIQLKNYNNQITCVIIGDRYFYGSNYVITPVYRTYPVIYNWLWGSHYRCWHSPYRHNHYPHWYHYRPYHGHRHHGNVHHHKSSGHHHGNVHHGTTHPRRPNTTTTTRTTTVTSRPVYPSSTRPSTVRTTTTTRTSSGTRPATVNRTTTRTSSTVSRTPSSSTSRTTTRTSSSQSRTTHSHSRTR
jgi:hypothetical protein